MSLSLQYGPFHYSPFANIQKPTTSTFFNRFSCNWYQNSWFIKICHIRHSNHQGCHPLLIQAFSELLRIDCCFFTLDVWERNKKRKDLRYKTQRNEIKGKSKEFGRRKREGKCLSCYHSYSIYSDTISTHVTYP